MRQEFLVVAALAACPLPAQNLVPNGEFHQGAAGWTLTAFNDPLGSTGFARSRVTTNGPSMAVFADFQTLSPVMSATFLGPQTFVPAGSYPLRFDVGWEKQVTAPIPSVTVNRVELRVKDALNTVVFTATQNAPNQTGLIERASYSGVLTIANSGNYAFELFMRHSNLAGIPFKNWVDNIVCGGPVVDIFGTGCAGSGGFTPLTGSDNEPALNTANFAIELHDAFAPTAAFFVLGTSNTLWPGGPLPFNLGGGCRLFVDPEVNLTILVAGAAAGTGTAAVTLPIANNPSFRGWRLFCQWGIVDPAVANPYGLATTAGLGFTVQ